MTTPLNRRHLLAAAAGLAAAGPAPCASKTRPGADAEFYELRRYRVEDAGRRASLLDHVAGALLPAWGRAGVGRVGVFVASENGDEGDHDVHVLLTLPTLDVLGELDERLAADAELAESAGDFYAATDQAPAYTRIESRLLRAFESMPALELPPMTAKSAPRIFELRTYESHTMDAARRKVEMFDRGETQLMRDVGLGPVFFGATRIGHDVPNLTYMLSAENAEAHAEHWKAFLAHPEWDRMKVIPRYAKTVSKITSTFLAPADCSQI